MMQKKGCKVVGDDVLGAPPQTNYHRTNNQPVILSKVEIPLSE